MSSSLELPRAGSDPSVLAALFDAAPFGVVLEDGNGRVEWCNEGVANVLGRPCTECLGRPAAELASEHQSERGGVAARVVVAPGEAAVYYLLPAAEDAGVRPSLQRMLDARLGVDAATGVLDEASVHRELGSEVSRSRRYGNPLSVVMMRLSPRADRAPGEVMSAVARALREQLRWADIVGRLGEREFLLVLPETDGEAARALIDKLAAALAGGEEGGYRADFAASGWQRGDDVGRLLERALAGLPDAA